MGIRVENINKYFGKKQVLSDVSFEIGIGETCVILGPSGCGKTTLLEIISGLQKQSSGKIFFEDKDISKLEPYKREVSMVFQNNALYPNMNVFQNVEFPLKIKKVDKSTRISKVEGMLDLVHLLPKKTRSVVDLSGGEKQRVAIARALIVNPKLFIMDEPLSNLDSALRNSTRKEIMNIKNKTKTTMLYVTHDQNEARNIADKVVIMNDGKVVQVGTPKQLIEKPSNLFVLKTFYEDSLNVFTKNSFERIFNKLLNCDKVAVSANAFEVREEGIPVIVESTENHTNYNLIRVSCMGETFVVKSDYDFENGKEICVQLKGQIHMF